MVNKEEFIRYENLRKSGVVNMYDLNYILATTWLNKEQVLFIMKNYDKLKLKYLGE